MDRPWGTLVLQHSAYMLVVWLKSKEVERIAVLSVGSVLPWFDQQAHVFIAALPPKLASFLNEMRVLKGPALPSCVIK